MTIQQIVAPESIESGLVRIWESLAKENKPRASLFNLVVFTRLSPRTDYFRTIVQRVVEKFPCRTLFISHDEEAKHSYLKTAISVVIPEIGESGAACDQIDIGVAGETLHQVPFLVLPHILPDLPVYLLWAEDPSHPHPLFSPLASLATRVIFDSESADDLKSFAKSVLDLHQKKKMDVADLNWARTEGWRDLIASLFDTPIRLQELHEISSVKISYNKRETEFFSHPTIQSVYLLFWLASQLGWNLKEKNEPLAFSFLKEKRPIEAALPSVLWEKLGSGTITEVEILSNKHFFKLVRAPEHYHYVNVHIASDETCDLPYPYLLGQTASGQSLVKEITTKGTSRHYLDMLNKLVHHGPSKL